MCHFFGVFGSCGTFRPHLVPIYQGQSKPLTALQERALNRRESPNMDVGTRTTVHLCTMAPHPRQVCGTPLYQTSKPHADSHVALCCLWLACSSWGTPRKVVNRAVPFGRWPLCKFVPCLVPLLLYQTLARTAITSVGTTRTRRRDRGTRLWSLRSLLTKAPPITPTIYPRSQCGVHNQLCTLLASGCVHRSMDWILQPSTVWAAADQ